MKKCTTYYHQDDNAKSEILKNIFERRVEGCKEIKLSKKGIGITLPNGYKIPESKVIEYLNTLPSNYSNPKMQEMSDDIREVGISLLKFSDDTNRPHIVS